MANSMCPSTAGGAVRPAQPGKQQPDRAARPVGRQREGFTPCPRDRPVGRADQVAPTLLAQGARRARWAVELARTGGTSSYTRGRHTARREVGW